MVTITKEDLEKMYLNHTNAECCIKLGVTQMTLLSYLKKAGIKLKGKGNNLANKIEVV